MTRPKAILVVDDDFLICTVFKSVAGAFNVKMDTAVSEKEAKALICKNVYDYVFLDIKLDTPHGGMEVLRCISMIEPTTTVVIMSGTVTLDDVMKDAMALGVLSFISKPVQFSVEYLCSIFRRLSIPPSGKPPNPVDV